jgi:hypothetical protein
VSTVKQFEIPATGIWMRVELPARDRRPEEPTGGAPIPTRSSATPDHLLDFQAARFSERAQWCVDACPIALAIANVSHVLG